MKEGHFEIRLHGKALPEDIHEQMNVEDELESYLADCIDEWDSEVEYQFTKIAVWTHINEDD